MTTLLAEKKGNVLLLTFNRPERKNAFSNEQWELFANTLNEAREDNSVNVVVLAGAGGNFSSGVDLAEFGEVEGEHPFNKTVRAVINFDKPLIAAVEGVAIGGGATLTFHCDVIYVADNLRMRLPFVNLGLVPEFAASYTLQSIIGQRRAAELFYTAEWIDADRALETGIATAKFSADELLDKAMSKAHEMAQWPVNALRETKRCLQVAHRRGIDAALEAEQKGMEKQAGSAENIEAITAFLEKRPADFQKLLD